MQHKQEKMQRSLSPRPPIRNFGLQGQRDGNQRPSSAKVLPSQDRATLRNLFNNKMRSNSARIPRAEPMPEKEEQQEDTEMKEGHKSGCPWGRGRSRSKYRLNLAESSSGILHPKPWGARNPNDIPCFCKLSSGQRDVSRGPAGRSPSRLHEFMSRHERQASKTKVAEIVSALCTILDRKKVKMSDIEFTLLLEKIKEKLLKYKDQPPQNQQPQQKTQQKQQQKRQAQEDKRSPVRRPRNVQSLSPVPQPTNYQQMRSVSKENLGDQPRGTMPLVGKVESKKYYIELSAEEQIPSDFKQFMGMMNPRPEKQLVLMDNGVHTFVPPPEYTVLNTGVQLRHHAENTTLLLGNQRLAAAPHMKPLPITNIISSKSPLTLNGKPKRT